MGPLTGVSILCFTASYFVALGMEVSRLFFRLPVRWLAMLLLTSAGLLAHTVYLALRAGSEGAGGAPLSSWYDWYLVAAWVLAAAYLGLTVSRPQTNVGLFLLPVVLALIAVGYAFRAAAPFPRDRALTMWGVAHGSMLLLGTITVSLGFAAGVMYLVQSWRLKHHRSPQAVLKLPSLEWLQAVNKQALVFSSCFIALGLVAGMVLNAVKSSGQRPAVPWNDSVVLSSAVLLVWLLAATAFEWLYKPAQQGRKVAYLTVASFLFLALVTVMLLVGDSQHAQPRAGGRGQGSGFRVQGGAGRFQVSSFRFQGSELWFQGLRFKVQSTPATRIPNLNPNPNLNPAPAPALALAPPPTPAPSLPLSPSPSLPLPPPSPRAEAAL